jgi:2-keto-4-pentenoate hydratase/2-oxohepta-3-ene-1,7-dioic acid hydratase in catechol pathway
MAITCYSAFYLSFYLLSITGFSCMLDISAQHLGAAGMAKEAKVASKTGTSVAQAHATLVAKVEPSPATEVNVRLANRHG